MASRKAAGKLPLALELISNDHRKVEALFDQYEEQKDDEDESRRDTAMRICKELTVHALAEEKVFYPWLREALEEDDMEMVEEAQVEHNGAKDLIAQIEAAESVDDKFDAMVKVLSEYIKHHVKEEEQEIFPKVKDQAEELDELGQEFAAAESELKEEVGLDEDAEDAPPPGKKGKRGDQRAPR